MTVYGPQIGFRETAPSAVYVGKYLLLARASHGSRPSFRRDSAKSRGLTTPSQGAHRVPRKHRVPPRRVDGTVCPQGFRPGEKCGSGRFRLPASIGQSRVGR
jgi:hypothetical protein